jgi:hypothetical protein
MVLEMTHSSMRAEIEMTHITIAMQCFMCYKYLIRLTQITISQFFFHSRLGFAFLAIRSQSVKDKRDTKCARSPSKEESSSQDSAKTPPPTPFGSPSLLTSEPEVSSRCPRSPVWEQGGVLWEDSSGEFFFVFG